VLSNADEIITSKKNAPQNTDFPSSDPYSRVARGYPSIRASRTREIGPHRTSWAGNE